MAGIVIRTDIIAPNSIWEAGVTGRLERRNQRGANFGGFQNINVGWSKTKRHFTWPTVPFSIAVWQSFIGLWEVTDAGAYGFLLQDPGDPSASHDTGTVSLISAPAHTYQLKKRFTAVGSSPAATFDRTVKYVKATGFELKISGVTQELGVDYTLSAFTGVVTIPSDPAAGDVTWSGVPYVPVHFARDDLEWELVAAGSEEQRLFRGPRVELEEVKK